MAGSGARVLPRGGEGKVDVLARGVPLRVDLVRGRVGVRVGLGECGVGCGLGLRLGLGLGLGLELG